MYVLACTDARTYVRMYVCTYACMYDCMYVCISFFDTKKVFQKGTFQIEILLKMYKNLLCFEHSSRKKKDDDSGPGNRKLEWTKTP